MRENGDQQAVAGEWFVAGEWRGRIMAVSRQQRKAATTYQVNTKAHEN